MPDHSSSSFSLEVCGDLRAFRDALGAEEFSQVHLLHTTEGEDPLWIKDTVFLSRRAKSCVPYHTLVRLFVLGEEVSEPEVRSALGSPIVDQLCRVGLLHRAGESIRSIAALVPCQDLYIASDFNPNVTGQSLMPDHVLGVAASSLALASLTPRRKSETALDLGTGSGFQALLLAGHSARVVGTDSSRRSLNFAEFNARLNGIPNIEFREGSLYEPIGERQFDLIVSNPPFMLAPAQRYLFRDSSLPGDSISERILLGAGERLRHGGYAVVVFNWLHTDPRDPAARPKEWLKSTCCDALLFHFGTLDPVAYAVRSLFPTEGHDQKEYARQMDERLDYYERQGVKGVNEGVIILRRSTRRANWVLAQSVKAESAGSCSEQVERIFQAQDYLLQLEDMSDLLSRSLTVVAEHQLEVTLHAHDGGWRARYARLEQTKGLEFGTEVDQYVSSIVAKCDGKHPLRGLVDEAAGKMGVRFEELAPECLAVVRNLMQTGFFVIP